MNCFEARNDFVAFWQKKLSHQRRMQLLTHLRGCVACDHSFRTFALTAPVLYSATEPESSSGARRPIGLNTGEFDLSAAPSNAAENRTIARTLNRILPAFVMAAVAATALYYTTPPHTTFEDAIAADNLNAEVASYSSTDNFFGQEFMIQDTVGPDRSDE